MTGKWVRARYKATYEEIAARCTEWEITGPAEVRETGRPIGEYFRPFRNVPPIAEQSPDMRPALDAIEAALVLVFLRRYVTWCARRRRFPEMEGAAALYRSVA